MRAEAQGFVLAGGRSARMGEEKALVRLGGRPLIEYALAVLRGAEVSASIAGARCDLSRHAPVVADEREDGGPLVGVCAAMRSARAQWILFTTVDMPLLPAELVVEMLEAAAEGDGAVLMTLGDGFAQTFPVVLHRELLPYLDRQLADGYTTTLNAFHEAARCAERRVRVLLLDECARRIAESDGGSVAPREWLLNLNTPEEVKRVEAILRARKSI